MLAGKEKKLTWILGKYFLLLSLLSMLIGLSIYSVLTYHSQKNISWVNLTNLRNEQARFLGEWFWERSNIINNISFYEVVKKQDLAEMKVLFKEQLGITRGFENLGYADKEGNILLYGDVEYTNANIADRDYFKLAMQGVISVGEMTTSKITNAPVVTVSSPVISEQGQILGVVFAPLKWSKILQIISLYPLGKTGEAYLIDSKGRIFSSNPNKTKEQLETKVAMINTLIETENGYAEYKDCLGSQVFGAYQQINNSAWGLLVEIDKAELFAFFCQDLGLVILFSLFILGAVIYPCSRYLTRKIVSPLEQMTTNIIQFADCCEKETNCQLADGGVFYDEVAAIKESFGEIREKISYIRTIMQSQIFYEPLTGLANMRYFLLRGQEIIELAYRKHTSCSLVYISIDKFMQIKEEFGQEVYERLVVHIADLLGSMARPSDILGRLDGDIFTVALPETSAEEARSLVEKFRVQVAESAVEVEFNAFSLTVSIGVATFLGDSEKFPSSLDLMEKLFEESRKMMSWAQEKGGNRVELSCSLEE